MTRIGTAAQTSLIVSTLLETQAALFDVQTQVSTEEISQDFEGIAIDSLRLLTVENTRDTLEQFNDNNDIASLRLDITQTAVEGVDNSLTDFRTLLRTFQQNDPTEEVNVDAIQLQAFNTLIDIQALLNTEADGRFVFSGAATQSEPVSLGLSTLADFQETFDGARVTVPTTASAVLNDFSFSTDDETDSPNFLTFQEEGPAGFSRVTSTSAQFLNAPAGTTITLSGTVDGANDGTFTVAAVDPNGFFIDIVTEQLADEGNEFAPVTATFGHPNDDVPAIFDTFSTDVIFDRETNTITAQTSGALADIPEGSVFTIEGTTDNDGTFTVQSNDGTSLVIESQSFVSQGAPASSPSPFFTAAATDQIVTAAAIGEITFTDSGGSLQDTITLTNGSFTDDGLPTGTPLTAGERITIGGTGTANDGQTFTIASVADDGLGGIANVATLIPTDAVTAGASTSAPGTIDVQNGLTFVDNGTSDTIIAPPGTFTSFEVGQQIEVAGTGTGNDGEIFTISAISDDGTTLTLSSSDSVTAASNLAVGNLTLRSEFLRFEADANGTGANTAVLSLTAAPAAEFVFADNAPAADTITLNGGSAFTDDGTPTGTPLPAGTQIVIAGGNGPNQGTFTIASVGGTNNEVATLIPTDTLTNDTEDAGDTLNAFSQLTFTNNPPGTADTISGAAGTFLGADGEPLAAGVAITISGQDNPNNNGTFIVASTSSDGSTVTLESDISGNGLGPVLSVDGATNSFTFTDNGASADTITLSGASFEDSFGNALQAGDTITISGTGTANDGLTFSIASIADDGLGGVNNVATLSSSTLTGVSGAVSQGTLEVQPGTAVTESSTPSTLITVDAFTGTISTDSYFNGSTVSATQRVSESQSFEFDLTAADPAFEKGIRALTLIAQGQFGTEGGLDQNLERIGQALFLLDDALEVTNTSPPPFGPELEGSIEATRIELGFQRVLIDDVAQRNTELISFFDSTVSDIEVADPLESITALLDLQRTLDASFQAFATVSSLTLLDFI